VSHKSENRNPESNKSFSTLALEKDFLKNLQSLGYLEMTDVQSESLPHIFRGKDVIVKAKTGSGKTIAFGIGLLSKLNPKHFSTQALILCPTRELADQVAKEIRKLARAIPNTKVLTLCGGTPFGPQVGSLERGAHIVVGTPGRLLDHLRKGTLKLERVRTLVFDEADRMLDMGFHDSMLDIVATTPKERQTLLFSATYPDTIKQLSRSFQNKPVDITVESIHEESTIEQLFFEIKKHERNQTLVQLLAHYQPTSTVIFCNTKRQCQDVADHLKEHGVHALAIHGDLEQKDRDQVLVRFSNKSCSVLVATDVAARGLDIKDIQAVINYEISRDPEVHIHRIGRTGRAGSKGLALSIFTPSEAYKVNAIEDYQKQAAICDVPESLNPTSHYENTPPMVTLQIDGGKKSKIRPGDILGALTGDAGIPGDKVGKIDIQNFHSYVAIERSMANTAFKKLSAGKIKGRSVKLRKLK